MKLELSPLEAMVLAKALKAAQNAERQKRSTLHGETVKSANDYERKLGRLRARVLREMGDD